MDIVQKLLNFVKDDPDLLKVVIFGGESCVTDYDMEKKA